MNPIPEDIRDNELLIIAWRDCLAWAITQRDIIQAYEKDTGNKWTNGQACMMKFIQWHNQAIWGKIDQEERDK